MTHAVIKTNIERLLKEKNWKVSDLEKKLPGRHINNIFRGVSKNPTIEILQSIAEAFEIEIQELVSPVTDSTIVNRKLLLDACNTVIQELESIPESPKITYNTIFSVIRELYEYSLQLNLNKIDPNFAKWLVQKYYKN